MGREKSLLPINGRTMIEHVIATMRPLCGSLCIVGDDTESFRFTGIRVIPDLVQNAGPLGGIHAALTTLGVSEILCSPCDTPLVSTQLLQYIRERADHAPACVARAADGLHPLCGIYRSSALPAIERAIAAGRFKLIDVLQELGAAVVDITPGLPFYHPDLFLNVNDPEGLARVTELLRV